MSLRALDSAKSVYSIPEDDLLGEVLIPGMQAATSARCMVGFFDSAAFRHLAPGLAAFVNNPNAGPLKVLASPVLSAVDKESIAGAVENGRAVVEAALLDLLEGARLSEHALARYAHRCLAYLVASGRLELRFAILKTGLFHPKVWILGDGNVAVVVQGSSNFTAPGFLYNFETVSVERPWRGEDSAEKVVKFSNLFHRLWSRDDPNAVVLDVPAALKLRLLVQGQEKAPPTIAEYLRAWRADAASGREIGPLGAAAVGMEALDSGFVLPIGLEYSTGRFSHQGKAVDAWEHAGRRGILAMATGSGKTVSALVAAARLQVESPRLFVTIAVPYRPLLRQWEKEVRRFGIAPISLVGKTRSERLSALGEAIRELRHGVVPASVVVATHDYLVSAEFAGVLKSVPEAVSTLLIADEVHNLGRPGFIRSPPTQFRHRLGLSATPERQYDPEGTRALFDFFGPKVFEFGLEDAIGTCLVPYDYDIFEVGLEGDEVQEWLRLTEELRKAGFGQDSLEAEDAGKLPARIVKLLVRRRGVVEGASGKLSALSEALDLHTPDAIKHTLVYATDKDPDQLKAVNALLLQHGVLFHQVTQEESGDRKALELILERFAAGDIQVLTAKRVLDEGVDIPEVKSAFLLASSTVRRQWIQRRGRVLRTCDRIAKTKARIVDFVVRPPPSELSVMRTLQRQEVARAEEFARLADNAGDPGGALDVIRGMLG